MPCPSADEARYCITAAGGSRQPVAVGRATGVDVAKLEQT